MHVLSQNIVCIHIIQIDYILKDFKIFKEFFLKILDYIKGVRTHIKILCDTNDSLLTVYRYIAIN